MGLKGYLTELRRRLARGAVAEEQLRLAQDGTGVGVYQLDFAAGTAFASPSLCRLLGQPVMDGPIPLDAWFAALNPTHVLEARQRIDERVARGELSYEVEQRIETGQGSIRWLQTHVRLQLNRGGTLVSACGATVDITERKRVNLLLERTQREPAATIGGPRPPVSTRSANELVQPAGERSARRAGHGLLDMHGGTVRNAPWRGHGLFNRRTGLFDAPRRTNGRSHGGGAFGPRSAVGTLSTVRPRAAAVSAVYPRDQTILTMSRCSWRIAP